MDLAELLVAVILTVGTTIVHVTGFYALVVFLHRAGQRHNGSIPRLYSLKILTTITLAIVALHLIEVGMWAAVFWAIVDVSWRAAVDLSLGCYSTLGSTEVRLPANWLLLEKLEAIVGVLMFGLSTAFIFSLMNQIHDRWWMAAPKEHQGV